MPTLNPNLVGGLLFAAVGLYFFLGSFELPLGTASRMGPGYLPMVLGAASILVGLVLAVSSFAREESWPTISWRSAATVLGSIALFGLLFANFGLVPAVFGSTLLLATADNSSRPLSSLVLALALSSGSWAVFILALGMTVPIFRIPA